MERFVFDLAGRFPPDRLRVIGPRHRGDRAFDEGLSFPIDRLERGRLLPPRLLRHRLEEVTRRWRPDVVLFGHALPLGLLGPRVEAMGVPYAFLTHGAEYWLARVPGFSLAFRYAASRATRAFAISSCTARAVARVMPPGVPVDLLSPGVDTARFRPDIDGAAVRRHLGIGDGPMILCVARMVPRKGHDVLIRALGEVRRRVPGAVLVLVGEGPNRRRLEALARGRTDHVRFTGEVRDHVLPAYYAACDVFALPCRTRWNGLEVEGFGVVFMEAAASGKPVVAGDSGGVSEAVVSGETGIVVDGRQEREVATALVRLLLDRSLARAMGERARERAEALFEWDSIVERLGLALRQTAGVGDRGSLPALTRARGPS